MFAYTRGKPLPDYGLFGVYKKFRRISVQLTSRCHNRCAFCFIPGSAIKQHGTMNLDDFSLILRAIPDYSGIINLCLNGESLLLDNLSEYCALTRAHWPNCTIQLVTTLNIDRGPR